MSVRLRPSPFRLRSVNGKHAPVVRPRCGFDSCRRLLHTPVAQRRERCPATAEAAGSGPAGRTTRGRSSEGRAPGRHLGEARSIRVVRFTGPWCNGSTTSSNLVGPGSTPGGPAATTRSSRAEAARLSLWKNGLRAVRFRRRAPTAPHDRDARPAAGRHSSGYRLLIDRSRVRVPPGASHAPVAQLAEQFRAVQPRPQQSSYASTAGRRGSGYLTPGAVGGREPPPGECWVSTFRSSPP